MRHAADLKQVLQRMDQSLDEHREGVRGEISLHAPTSALLGCLPKIVAGFMADHPLVDIQVREWDSVKVVRSVEDGSAHIGVYSSYVSAPVGLRTFAYASTRLVVVAEPGHPICRDETTCFEETLKYEQVVLQDGDSFSALLLHMQHIASSFELPLRVRCRVASFGTACRFVQAGAGIAILPADVASMFAGPLHLRLVDLSDPWAATRHDVCARQDAVLPVAARLLLERLEHGMS
jgi:DNA-binding transcriptional LysR family regulator